MNDVCDLDGVLRELARALKPGGTLVYSALHPRGGQARWTRTFEAAGQTWSLPAHWHSTGDHEHACAAAGLQIDARREPEIPGAGRGRTRHPCEATVRWLTRAVTFVNAVVVGPHGRLYRSLRVRGTRIDSLGVAPDRRDVVIDVDESIVLPGLINAHDHLELNSLPRLKWRERYDNVREWIADFQPRFASDPALAAVRADTLDDRLWVGGAEEPAVGRDHRVPSQPAASCAQGPLSRSCRPRASASATRCGIDGDRVAEVHHRDAVRTGPGSCTPPRGSIAMPRREVERLSQLGCLEQNTVLVHGVALDACTSRQVLQRGGALDLVPDVQRLSIRPHRRCAAVRRRRTAGAGVGLEVERRGRSARRAARRARDAPGQRRVAFPRRHRGRGACAAPRRRRSAGVGRAGGCLHRPRALARSVRDARHGHARRRSADDGRRGGRWWATRICGAVFAGARRARRSHVDGAPKLLARWIASRAARLRLRGARSGGRRHADHPGRDRAPGGGALDRPRADAADSGAQRAQRLQLPLRDVRHLEGQRGEARDLGRRARRPRRGASAGCTSSA